MARLHHSPVPAGRSAPARILIIAIGVGLGICLAAAHARAATWMQISCVNPNGSASNSEGWSESTSGGGAPVVSTSCGPGTPMHAYLSALAAAPPGATAQLQYTPPGGSTLDGGTIDASLAADGYGTNSAGTITAVTEGKLMAPTPADEFKQCVAWLVPCSSGSDTLEYSGPVAIPSDSGGDLYAQANCASTSTTPCNQNARNGAWSRADVAWADILLNYDQSPQGANFTGSALQPKLRGTGHVVFTASDGNGPGVANVAVAIDGKTVYSANPNPNGGACVPVGTDAATGALEFDHSQPCLDSEVVDVPVPTSGLSDGPHELAITVTDAARNPATVLDQTITTSNPHLTPRPRGAHAIHAQFAVHWAYHFAHTRIVTIRVVRLPRGAGVTASCAGRGCPRIGRYHVNAPQIRRLLRRLTGRWFRAGDRLHLDVTERNHRPEHVEVVIRDRALPVYRLLRR